MSYNTRPVRMCGNSLKIIGRVEYLEGNPSQRVVSAWEAVWPLPDMKWHQVPMSHEGLLTAPFNGRLYTGSGWTQGLQIQLRLTLMNNP